MSDDLARDHMRAQVDNAAAVQTLAAALWHRYVDPDAFDASFGRAAPALAALIRQGRRRAADIADGYYGRELLAAGVRPDALAAFVDELPPEALVIAVEAGAKRNVTTRELAAVTAGTTDRSRAAVLEGSLKGTLAVVKARTAAGGTDRLLAVPRMDRRVKGWSRVSDGSPCARCALLVSRGPVYTTRATATFKRHDGCGCSAKLIADGDGWTDEARMYREQWDAAGDEKAFRADLTHAQPRHDPMALVDLSRFAT